MRDVIEISSDKDKDARKPARQYTKREKLELIEKMTKQMKEAARQLTSSRRRTSGIK